jgi:hypothetical protein
MPLKDNDQHEQARLLLVQSLVHLEAFRCSLRTLKADKERSDREPRSRSHALVFDLDETIVELEQLAEQIKTHLAESNDPGETASAQAWDVTAVLMDRVTSVISFLDKILQMFPPG